MEIEPLTLSIMVLTPYSKTKMGIRREIDKACKLLSDKQGRPVIAPHKGGKAYSCEEEQVH